MEEVWLRGDRDRDSLVSLGALHCARNPYVHGYGVPFVVFGGQA